MAARFVGSVAAAGRIRFIDLTDDFRAIPWGGVDSLFLPDNRFPPAGNRFVAEALKRHLDR